MESKFLAEWLDHWQVLWIKSNCLNIQTLGFYIYAMSLIMALYQGSANFSSKGPETKYLRFGRSPLHLPCCYSRKVATDNMLNSKCGCVPIWLHLQKQSQNNYKMQNYKTLDDNVGENPDGPGYGDDFLDTTPKTWSMEKIDFIKIRLFLPGEKQCQENEEISHSLGGNICQRHIFWRMVVQNIQKLLKLNSKNTYNPT